MASEHPEGVKSTASIGGHPLHPALIPFPIAFITGGLAADVLYLLTDNVFWEQGAVWLIGAGVVMAALAGLLGLIDFLTIKRVRDTKTGWWHLILNVVMLGVSLVNLLMRLNNPEVVLPAGIILSAVANGLLVISGWLGGELVFRHKIGVVGHGMEQAEEFDRERRRAYGAGD